MKRFILLILCVSLLFAYVPANAANTPVSTVSVVESAGYIELLQAAGIINKSSEIDPAGGISRGDFMAMASQIALHGNIALGTTVMFSDVNEQNENFDAINMLSAMGIISGYADGTFHPDELITQGEAAKVVIKSLGWDAFMINDKNNTSEYFTVAANNKFFKRIELNIEGKMTWADTAVMFMNVLSTKVCVQTKFGNNAEYDRSSDVTYFNLYFDIYRLSGRVTDNGTTSLSGESTIPEGNILIDNTLLIDSREYKTDLLGMDVDAYYRQTDGKDAKLIYAITSDDQLLTLTSNMIYNYDDYVYNYRVDEKDEYDYKAKLLPEFDLIYNGKAVLSGGTIDLSTLHPESGCVELIDYNMDKRYETVKLWVYRSVVVSSKDEERLVIYDKLGGTPIYADEADDFVITDENGRILDFADIQPMDILSVAVSADEQLIRIIRNKSGFNAKIEEISSDGLYMLSGAQYRPTSDFLTRYEGQLKLGIYADFYVNHEGYLVYMDTSAEQRAGLAYLVDAVKDKKGIREDYLVKLFTSDGKMKVYRLAEKVTVDGNRISKVEAFGILHDGDEVNRQLLDYSLDGEESVNMLDLAYDGTPGENESAYSLHRHGANTTASMTFLSNTFNGKILTNAATKVFLIPTDGDEEAYKITDQSYFHNVGFVIDAYRHDPESALAEAIVMKVDYTGRKYSYPFRPASLVKSISSELNADGNVVQKLVCYENGSEVTVYTAEDHLLQVTSGGETIEIAPGDIIRYGTNTKGVIDKDNVILLYDADNADFEPVSQGSFTGSFFMYTGYAYGCADSILRVSPSAEDGVSEHDLYNYDISVGKIIVVSEGRDGYTFRVGTEDDIFDYKSTGTDCSKVFVYTWSTRPRMIVVYN